MRSPCFGAGANPAPTVKTKGEKIMKRMTVYVTLLVSFMFVFFPGESAAAAPDRVPTVVSDDFETGEMHAWEAYPYAQDIGYEPFTIPKREPTHNNSRYALTKIHRPNNAVEIHEGFTKQFDLWTSDDSRIKVAVFLTSDRKPDDLEFSLCLFDGRRFFYTIQSPEVNRWLELDIPIHLFTMNRKRLGSGEHIQAVTILARYSSASHIPSYNITIDDFSLIGEIIPIIHGYKSPSNGWGIGCEYKVGGHVFQGFLTNSSGLTTDQYIPGGNFDIKDNDYRIGFNIYRSFWF